MTALHGVHEMPANEYRSIRVGPSHTATVDAADYARTACYNWRLLTGHNGKLYAFASFGGGTIYMHRLVTDTQPGYETDHINGNGLDNRRANLRQASASQNRANMGKPKRGDGRPQTSIYKGVSWNADRSAWRACIQHSGRSIHLGRYTSETDAARAYDRAAVAQWGEFAKVNFPDEVMSK